MNNSNSSLSKYKGVSSCSGLGKTLTYGRWRKLYLHNNSDYSRQVGRGIFTFHHPLPVLSNEEKYTCIGVASRKGRLALPG